MGLRCSLLGHDYGASFVERDREERGNEVVVTERELQECRRCGAENVTSENTEVRSVQSTAAADGDAADAAAGETAGAGSRGGAFTAASDAIERAEADMQAAESERSVASTGTADERSTTSTATADADADDAVIIDESPGDAPGSEQWDDQADVDPDAEPAPAPDLHDEDVEFVDGAPTSGESDSAPGDDAGLAGADAATAGGAASPAGERADADTQAFGGAQAVSAEQSTDRARGEWPDHDGADADVDADGDVAFQFGDENDAVAAADTGFTSAGPLDQGDGDDLDFALYCPECAFDRHAAGSSLRAGDICPDCRKGYLAEDR